LASWRISRSSVFLKIVLDVSKCGVTPWIAITPLLFSAGSVILSESFSRNSGVWKVRRLSKRWCFCANIFCQRSAKLWNLLTESTFMYWLYDAPCGSRYRRPYGFPHTQRNIIASRSRPRIMLYISFCAILVMTQSWIQNPIGYHVFYSVLLLLNIFA
jgi:hypothetical protein